MSDAADVSYECTLTSFRPVSHEGVRWLGQNADDFELWLEFAKEQAPVAGIPGWKAPERAEWDRWEEEKGFRSAALIVDGRVVSVAACWKYSDDAWELAGVGTREACRNRGYGKAVCSFVTEHILAEGRLATCSTADANTPMRKTAEAIGYVLTAD